MWAVERIKVERARKNFIHEMYGVYNIGIVCVSVRKLKEDVWNVRVFFSIRAIYLFWNAK